MAEKAASVRIRPKVCEDGGLREADVAEEELEVRLEGRLQKYLQKLLRAEIANFRAELLAAGPPPSKALEKLGQADDGGLAGGGAHPQKCGPELVDFRLTKSIWDVAIFVGSPELGCGGSALVALLLLLNVLLQAGFVLIVHNSLSVPEFSETDLQGLLAWRLRLAHDARFVAGGGGYSLADRVCAGDLTLESATEQMDKVALVDKYLPEAGEGMAHYFQGWVMCLLALAVWLLCTVREVSGILDFLGALRLLRPRRSRGSRRLCRTADGGYELRSINPGRRACAVLVVLLRLAVAGVLLWSGGMYLCQITSIEDLLLNAMALELVVHVDELVFQALAPASAMELIERLAPLKMRPWPRWRGADLKAAAAPVLVGGLLAAFWVAGLRHTIRNLKDAKEAICGGNRSFAFKHDGLGMVRVSGLPAFDTDRAYSSLDLASRAVKEVRDRTPPERWDFALLSPSHTASSSSSLAEDARKRQETVHEIYSTRRQTCGDALDRSVLPLAGFMNIAENQWRVWPRYMAHFLGRSEPVRSCAEVRQHCFFSSRSSHLATSFVRALCPVTCGCNNLLEGSLFASPELGCPSMCLLKVDNKERADTPCTDTTPSAGDFRYPLLLRWVEEFALASDGTLNLTWAFRAKGCLGLRLLENPCKPMEGQGMLTREGTRGVFEYRVFKVFTYFCPIECNCAGRGYTGRGAPPPDSVCPNTCCTWGMGVDIVATATDRSCQVFGPFPAAPFPPIATDSRCCYLLRHYAPLHERMEAVINRSGQASDEVFSTPETRFFGQLLKHLCHRCRRRCLETFRGLYFNATNRTPRSLCPSNS